MKVKLLEPIDGYEDVAEYRPPKPGEMLVGLTGLAEESYGAMQTPWLVLTPKPLPVVEPPKWLGVVRDRGCVGNRFVTYVDGDGWMCVVNGYGISSTAMVHKREVQLIRTANIPTSPELEALFKE